MITDQTSWGSPDGYHSQHPETLDHKKTPKGLLYRLNLLLLFPHYTIEITEVSSTQL